MTAEQIAWTLIGVLIAALLGNFWYLGSKIDSINARIDGLGESLNGRIDGQGDRIESLGARLDARIDALAELLQAHIERHAS